MQTLIQSWDTAVTTEPDSDFSVGMTWGYRDGHWYLLHVERTKLNYPDLKSRIRALQQQWNADRVIIERSFAGIPLLNELREEDRRSVYVGYQPRVDKETRMAAGCGKLATGRFHLPASADWLPVLRHELRAFPNGRHDDQVDALSQFLDWIGKRPGRCWQERQLNGGERPRRNIRRRPGRRRR
jgi:predicted phage terminase large subunit-like protein